jgi:hypothetical protein
MTNDHTKCKRPTAYTAEIGEGIFDRFVEGQSVRAICADSDMPNEETLLRWLIHEEEFRKIYDDALQMRIDGVADQFIFGVPKPPPIELIRGRGVRLDDADDPVLAHFRNDLRMWLLHVLLAKQPA